jgi:hypothetical protein
MMGGSVEHFQEQEKRAPGSIGGGIPVFRPKMRPAPNEHFQEKWNSGFPSENATSAK